MINKEDEIRYLKVPQSCQAVPTSYPFSTKPKEGDQARPEFRGKMKVDYTYHRWLRRHPRHRPTGMLRKGRRRK